ncbi:MAG: SAM-dependent methyltransferase [Promethearchaeota archaeon]
MDMWLIIGTVVIIILVSVIAFGISAVWPSLIGAPWVPVSKKTAQRMLELAKVTQEDTVVDLGSGDGRIIMMAAQKFGASAVGIEADPFRVLWSRGVIRRRGLNEIVEVIWGNFFTKSVPDATVVTVYQGQSINKRLKTKLATELTPGTRVVSYSFPFEEWTPVEMIKNPRLYLYVI